MKGRQNTLKQGTFHLHAISFQSIDTEIDSVRLVNEIGIDNM